MFEVVQVAERYLRSSLLVLGDEFMSAHVDASFLFRRRIYRLRRGRVQNFRCWGLSRPQFRAAGCLFVAMCGRLPVGKGFLDGDAELVGAAMCSAC